MIRGTRDSEIPHSRITGDRVPITFADDYDRRMWNWRHWWLHSNTPGTGYAPSIYGVLASGIYNRTDPRNREASMPALEGEAADTDRAIQAIQPGLRAVVHIFYLQTGSLAQKARMLGCRKESMLERLRMARRAILTELTRRTHVMHIQIEREFIERSLPRSAV
jgi:hypothetical protein